MNSTVTPTQPYSSATTPYPVGGYSGLNDHTSASAVSWAAIFAGAAGAAALSLILLLLGAGLGLSSVSPWADNGASATTIGVSTIVWITFMQLAASGIGGYVAGRLRTQWTGVHSDEVYFRDTAHGFLAWAVATLLTASLLTSAVSSIVSGGAKAGAAVAGGIGSSLTTVASAGAAGAGAKAATDSSTSGSDEGGTGTSGNSMSYYVDMLFRKPASATASGTPGAANTSNTAATSTDQTPAAAASEITRILGQGIANGSLPPDDLHYAGDLVAKRAGISQDEAEKRITETFNKVQAKINDAKTAAKDAADTARKASAKTALWLFVSLLLGAFVASLAATFGGRGRDVEPVTSGLAHRPSSR